VRRFTSTRPFLRPSLVCPRTPRSTWRDGIGGWPARERFRCQTGPERRCRRCYLRYPPLLRTSAITALVVGTVLVGINQGSTIADEGLTAGIAWPVALTYAIPFCVATWGALAANRR
jgi:hypothetical protein